MNFFNERFTYLPSIKPRYLVFSDLDETFIAHNPTKEQVDDLVELQQFLEKHTLEKKILFGWVTGSPIESVKQKILKYGIQTIPHFIASAMGTHITYHSLSKPLAPDENWHNFEPPEVFKQRVNKIVNSLATSGIKLVPQNPAHVYDYKQSYYYHKQSDNIDKQNLSEIQRLAENQKIALNLSRCNPKANDPDNCYDVDFIPNGTGKVAVVQYLANKYQIPTDRLYAFGDSGNDLPMLKAVNNGWLVNNAPEEIKEKHEKVSSYNYAKAILQKLQSII